MLSKKRYNRYSVQDFVCDESFQNWIYNADAENTAFWETLASDDPERARIMELASRVLTSISFREHQPAEGQAEASLQKVMEKIKAEEYAEVSATGSDGWQRVLKIAAVVFLTAGLAYFFYLFAYNKSGREIFFTAFGQTDTMHLPDASMVILNGHSSISYSNNWRKKDTREVWLEGEAFFDVKHIGRPGSQEPQKFKVHVGPLTVEVLGTAFNIRQRRNQVEIALLEGSVKLTQNRKDKAIYMLPGDLIRLDTLTQELFKMSTNTQNMASWTQKKLILSNPTLKDICFYLEDTYGKKIILSEPQLASKKVEGPILLDSLNDALFIISTVLNLTIVESNNTLILKSK